MIIPSKHQLKDKNLALILSSVLLLVGALSVKLLTQSSFDIRQQAQVYCIPKGEYCGTGSQFDGVCCKGTTCENNVCSMPEEKEKLNKLSSVNTPEVTPVEEVKEFFTRVTDISPLDCEYLNGCYIAANGPYVSSCYRYNAVNSGFICCNGRFKPLETEGISCKEPPKVIERPTQTPTPIPITPRPTFRPVLDISEAECKEQFNGCYVPPDQVYLSSCIAHNEINGNTICCNQHFYQKKLFPTQQCEELHPIGDPDYKVLKQNDPLWRDVPLPGGCEEPERNRFSASTCGPFSTMMLITNLTEEQVDPIEFVNQNYPNLTCTGSTVEQNVAVLQEHDMKTVYISNNQEEMRRYLRAGWNLFVRSRVDNIFHFILITGVNDDGSFVFEDPYYDAYTADPTFFSVIAVKHKK